MGITGDVNPEYVSRMPTVMATVEVFTAVATAVITVALQAFSPGRDTRR